MNRLIAPIKNEPFKEMLTLNLTHYSMLLKVNPKSKVPDLYKQAVDGHKDYVARMRNDPTKTDSDKALKVAQQANSQLKHMFRSLDSERTAMVQHREQLESTVASELKLDNTTKILLAQNMAAVLVNKEWIDVVSLIGSGDVETIRAMSLPAMKLTFDLHTKPERSNFIQTHAEQAFLGGSYETLQVARAANDIYVNIGGDLMGQYTTNVSFAQEIESTIVSDEVA